MQVINKKIFISLVFVAAFLITVGQEPGQDPVQAKVVEGDTLYVIELPAVDFHGQRKFKNAFQRYRYNRLVKNIRKVYPYARLAALKMEEYSEMLMEIEKESHRRKAMKQAEHELRAQFEGDLRSLTFSQGLILIKLVDRETRHTSYDLVKEFRGNISAVFWQSLGRVFGYNLRTKYDPYGEDEMIEEIVQLIEAGHL